jgi:gliding motility-associated protein GldM
MAGYKETPRQKMIAMMYLVLTALLALNVSKQILDAFLVVNESMETTNENFSKKLDLTLNEFKAQYLINPNKVGPFWQKAQAAHELSQALLKYVDSVKYTVIKKADGLETLQEAKKLQLREVKGKDNYDRTTRYFIGSSEDGSAGEARILKNRIEDYKKHLLDLVDPSYRNTMKIGMDTKGPFYAADGVKQNWEMHNFYRTILAADVTILNKIKAEVYNAEFDVTTYLLAAISMKDFKFDQIRAKVIPKSAYVFTGDDYQAEILVAAYDSKGNPDVRYVMGSDSLYEGNFKNATRLEGANGIVTLKLASGSQEGLKKFAGIIKIVTPLGDTIPYHFKDEFIVANPGITVSPSKMNVFYIGVDNPVDISVPGGPEKVLPVISQGHIRPEGKNWIVYDLPKGPREAIINVSAVFSGKTKSMGASTFRLKSIPDPVAQIAGVHEGAVDRSLLLASPYVLPIMPPGFDFDVKYMVTGFTFVTDYNGDIIPTKVVGNRLPADIVKVISTARRNKRIWLEDIAVKGPDGDRHISGIILKIQ